MRWPRGALGDGRRPEPPLDVGLAAERTAMAWQRTGLALAAVATLLVRLSDGDPLVAVPGVAGMALGLGLLAVGERRYTWVVEHVEGGRPSMAPRLVGTLTLGAVALSVTSMAFVAAAT